MLLYHFTCRHHIANIISRGVITTTESNIHRTIEHYGPDVVWLTNEKLFNQRCIDFVRKNLVPSEVYAKYNKHAIRVTVDIGDAQHWPAWSCSHKIKKRWFRALAKFGDPRSWYVVERCITQDDWIIIEDVQKNEVLWKKFENKSASKEID